MTDTEYQKILAAIERGEFKDVLRAFLDYIYYENEGHPNGD